MFFRLCSFGIYLTFLLFSTPTAVAQTAPTSPPALSIEELRRMLQADRAPWYSTTPLPDARPSEAPHDHAATTPNEETENRFGYWKYRHKELHARGVIDELLERTKGKNCCNGVYSGECRVSKVNVRERTAFVDGEWCPMSEDTRVTPLDSLSNINDGNEEVAVVCASKSLSGKKTCMGVSTYCIGVKLPKA